MLNTLLTIFVCYAILGILISSGELMLKLTFYAIAYLTPVILIVALFYFTGYKL